MCSCDGNNDTSFVVKHFSCDEWNVGNMFGELGKSKVYAENSGILLTISYGPSKHGINLATCDGSFSVNSL